MRMLPAQPYDTNSNAEYKVFKKFSGSTALGAEAVCFHSLNLPHHVKQRFGEADFVIVSTHGLFVFEVKGGLVSRDEDGIWHFIDRRGEDHTKRRSPFVQAEEAMHSIKNDLNKQFGHELITRMCIGYGVILPDCNLDITAFEWDTNILLSANNFDVLDSWLKRFVKYWKSLDTRRFSGKLLQQDIDQIKNYLRPEFEALASLSAQLDNIHTRMCKLTEDQFRLLDVAEVSDRVLCSGGAGTGKTFMASELCRRFAQPGINVLFVCKSLWLERYIHARLLKQNVTVSTIDQLEIKAKRNNIKHFDIIVVDEGQDLFNFDDLEKLEVFLKGSFEKGLWYFFHDINNQTGIFGCYEEEAVKYLHSMNPVNIPLKKNCRNTKPILEKIQEFTKCDLGNDGTGIGPEVVIHYYDSQPEQLLVKELRRLVEMEDIPLGDITILSPLTFNESCVSLLNRSSRRKIQVLDVNSVRELPLNNKISFAKIQNFKGLENRCIIIVDLDAPQKETDNLSLLYVGMSRSVGNLSLILHKASHL